MDATSTATVESELWCDEAAQLSEIWRPQRAKERILWAPKASMGSRDRSSQVFIALSHAYR